MARHAVNLAKTLDVAMLELQGVTIASALTPDKSLPEVKDPVEQLGHRYLIKYIRDYDIGRYSRLSGITHFTNPQYFTVTPICIQELKSALCLPAALPTPKWALLLDPDRVRILGPRMVRNGNGVEYFAPEGFTVDAIVEPGWAVKVR